MTRKLNLSATHVLALLLIGSIPAQPAAAASLEIPVALDWRILDQALEQQIFTGPERTAELFADRIRCNRLVLSEPRVGGTDDGHLRLLTTMRAQTGTPLGDKCRFAKSWTGLVETLQAVQVDSDTAVVSFRIIESTLLSARDGTEILPRFMKRWIDDHVHPRLGSVKVDLEPAIAGLQELLDAALITPGVADSPPQQAPRLQLTDGRASVDALVAILTIEVPDAPPAEPHREAPLTPEELVQWDAAWQSWDGFATWMIKTLAITADPELSRALAELLLEARYDLREALEQDDRDRDPVRDLFVKTWERLAPLVKEVQLGLPGGQALSYAVFVSAGDALAALDRLAPHLGLQLDRDAFRALARTLVPGVSDYDLRYDTAVDPDLRALLGLDPEFEHDRGDSALSRLASWLIRSVQAAQISPELVRRLNNWIPKRPEIDRYLKTVEQLLGEIARAERSRGKVPDRHLDTYDTLLRATAWQESCWRQYVERQGAVETIRSSAGSVGLMQINVHVWRGVYDTDAVHTDIGYNARAGNEILVHYLVDYAIRKGEHEIMEPPDSLARATYAIYNGGPRHLTRYRNPKTSAALKKIDNAFWQKYRAMQSEGPLAVKRCLVG